MNSAQHKKLIANAEKNTEKLEKQLEEAEKLINDYKKSLDDQWEELQKKESLLETLNEAKERQENLLIEVAEKHIEYKNYTNTMMEEKDSLINEIEKIKNDAPDGMNKTIMLIQEVIKRFKNTSLKAFTPMSSVEIEQIINNIEENKEDLDYQKDDDEETENDASQYDANDDDANNED